MCTRRAGGEAMAAKKRAKQIGGLRARKPQQPQAVTSKGPSHSLPAADPKGGKVAPPGQRIRPQSAARLVQGALSRLPPGYGGLLEDLKDRIRRDQVRTAADEDGA